VVFASLAGLGAALGVAAESTRHGDVDLSTIAGLSVAISVSAYLVVTGALQSRLNLHSAFKARFVAPFVIALLVIGVRASWLGIGFAVPLMGLVVTALVILESLLRRRRAPVPP
jgi:hypothetical protein